MTRIFISYSHDHEEHKRWVKGAAEDLGRRELEVVLDQTHLKPGADFHVFMESAVESSDFILLVCTPQYGAKVRNRQRGVGMETALIVSEIYDGASEKVVALLREGDYRDSIPRYMQSRLFVDVRDGAPRENWTALCDHLIAHRPADQIGTLVYEALFKYDKARIHDKPRLHELKRFTQFVETGITPEGRHFVIRTDPITRDLATILFQDPE